MVACFGKQQHLTLFCPSRKQTIRRVHINAILRKVHAAASANNFFLLVVVDDKHDDGVSLFFPFSLQVRPPPPTPAVYFDQNYLGEFHPVYKFFIEFNYLSHIYNLIYFSNLTLIPQILTIGCFPNSKERSIS